MLESAGGAQFFQGAREKVKDKKKKNITDFEELALDSSCHVILEKVTDFCAIITGSCHIVATTKYARKALKSKDNV